MPLDLTILGTDGTPEETVPLGVNDHWSLILRAAPAEKFPLLHRMHDYYDDACFAPTELEGLRRELESVRNDDQESLIDAIVDIAKSAETKGRELHALAD